MSQPLREGLPALLRCRALETEDAISKVSYEMLELALHSGLHVKAHSMRTSEQGRSLLCLVPGLLIFTKIL